MIMGDGLIGGDWSYGLDRFHVRLDAEVLISPDSRCLTAKQISESDITYEPKTYLGVRKWHMVSKYNQDQDCAIIVRVKIYQKRKM